MAVDGTMFVIGGHSTTSEFKDMYALDTEVDPPVWTEVCVVVLPCQLYEILPLVLPVLVLTCMSSL